MDEWRCSGIGWPCLCTGDDMFLGSLGVNKISAILFPSLPARPQLPQRLLKLPDVSLFPKVQLPSCLAR